MSKQNNEHQEKIITTEHKENVATAVEHEEQDVTTGGVEYGETTTEVGHEPTLFAEPIFHIGNFTITNSLLNSWVVVFILIIFSIAIRKNTKEVPGKLQNIVEMIIEGAFSVMDNVTGDRKKTLKFFPIVFALFIFILINNWLGLFPGIGSIGFLEQEHGHTVFVPWFRGATADLNTTLALALFAVLASHVVGVIAVGVWNYINKFVNIKALLMIPKKITKDPTIVLVNPIKMFVGIVEIVSEIAKVASLSFRLFGNIFAGEVLLASIAAIFAFLTPIPFMFLEVIVGIIQALVFAMLTLVYMTIATTEEEH